MSGDGFVERMAAITQGFMDARLVILGVELRLFDRLAEGPAGAAELARDLGLTPRGTEIVCDALVALELLTKDRGVYANTEEVDRHLVRGRPGSMAHITGHRGQMFRSWARLDEIVRHGRTGRERSKATLADREVNRNFILGMAEVGRHRVGPIIDRLGLEEAGHLVDLGGGPGHYCCEAVRRVAGLEATLVDLPLTVEVAAEYIAGQGLTDRVRTLACDFYRDELDLGRPADVVLISQVLHAEGPEENRALLRGIAPWVVPGGRVVVVENPVDEDRTSPRAGARFAVNMLAGTARGRTYTAAEIGAWLDDAGFAPQPPEDVAPRTLMIQGVRGATAPEPRAAVS